MTTVGARNVVTGRIKVSPIRGHYTPEGGLGIYESKGSRPVYYVGPGYEPVAIFDAVTGGDECPRGTRWAPLEIVDLFDGYFTVARA